MNGKLQLTLSSLLIIVLLALTIYYINNDMSTNSEALTVKHYAIIGLVAFTILFLIYAKINRLIEEEREIENMGKYF
jgi:hypothetical protein